MRFKLVEENELQHRARIHRKHQKGMSPFLKKDAGNVEHNEKFFNMANTPQSSAPTGGDGGAGEASGGAGMGESVLSHTDYPVTNEPDDAFWEAEYQKWVEKHHAKG